MATVRIHKMRRCPNCGGVTERFGHCLKKGHPMFPQTDDDHTTEPCDVVILDEAVKVVSEAIASFDGNWDERELADRAVAALRGDVR